GRAEPEPPRGFAVQARVNAETMAPDGQVRPASGVLATFEPPTGPGIRVDSYGYAGYRINPRFDSLLAKVVGRVTAGSVTDALARTARALDEFTVEGVSTNLPVLRRLLRLPDVHAMRVHTRFVEEHAAELAVADDAEPRTPPGQAGARVDAVDPLAVLAHGKVSGSEPRQQDAAASPDGMIVVSAPMQGTIIGVDVDEGATIHAGQPLLLMEAMKIGRAHV